MASSPVPDGAETQVPPPEDHRKTPLPSPMTLILGIALALACALTTNLGFLYKHRGACAAPGRGFPAADLVGAPAVLLEAVRDRHGDRRRLLDLPRRRDGDGAALGRPGGARRGIVLLAIMAERAFGLSVGWRQWLGSGMTAFGLILLGISLPAVHGAHSRYSVPGMIAFEAGLIASARC